MIDIYNPKMQNIQKDKDENSRSKIVVNLKWFNEFYTRQKGEKMRKQIHQLRD